MTRAMTDASGSVDEPSPMSTNAKPYKETLNLPVTRFDMKANLTVREPQIQARWHEQDLYGQVRQARARGSQGSARRASLCQRRDPHGDPSTRCSRISSCGR